MAHHISPSPPSEISHYAKSPFGADEELPEPDMCETSFPPFPPWIGDTPNGLTLEPTHTTSKKEPIPLGYKHDDPKKHVFPLNKALYVSAPIE